MTAARLLRWAVSMMLLQSSMVRKPNTPGRRAAPPGASAPFIGGMKARLPVAISSLS